MGGGRVLEMESEKIYNEGIAQGLSQGMSQGIASSILSFLSRCHEVPESLRERILTEKDIDKLNNWIMLAPYVSSIEEFEEKM